MTPEPVAPEFLTLQEAVLGRYSLVRELGRGGMGIVFLAREVALDRFVAIKLLPPALAMQADARERFVREARTAAQLAHPHIVPIHAVEQIGAQVFFVMEYIPGETLGSRLRRQGALPATEAMRIVQEVAWALALAHSRGVIHRDIKPDNILLDEASGRAVVTDFGIAHGEDGDASGAGMGTLHYMAPEQALGDPANARSDVYALGITAYQMVTGRRPFEGYDGAALLAAQANSDAPPVRTFAPLVSGRFAEMIDRAVLRQPQLRWPDIADMAHEIATARAVAPASPPLLRAFARVCRERINQLTGGITIITVLGAVLLAIVGSPIAWSIVFWIYFSSLITFLIVGGLTLVPSARAVLERGYGRAAALRAVEEEHREVGELPEPMRPQHDRVAPSALFAVSGLAVFLGLRLMASADAFLPVAMGSLLAVVSPLVILAMVRKHRKSRRRYWLSLMKGRFSTWLFRLAAIGLKDVRPAGDAAEPTALALGGAVLALFDRLPAGDRKMLPAVPDLVARLEVIALDRANVQHGSAVAALETLRLDLLRLQAGQIAAASMTEDLEKLRDVGFLVDGKIEAGR